MSLLDALTHSSSSLCFVVPLDCLTSPWGRFWGHIDPSKSRRG